MAYATRRIGKVVGVMGEQIRVFISSTYLDNVERRKLVEDAVLRAEMQPVDVKTQ